MPSKPAKGTQVQGKKPPSKPPTKGGPCPWLCNQVPVNVPGPGPAQAVLHPNKDVFVLKVAKIGATGDRRCKMELELVTPKGPDNKPPGRVDTREAQCDPDPPPCCCMRSKKKRK
ncbi:uncharacterized protein LOC106133748 [Amyelois transitella]|uniref:uncharacterized protein LOC106133748 n=1 Tax=Amyelois transitella TaxID=680683 RepID=UPI00067CD4A7|nr:uncharacterized protein LOC106133748 [Amyelois transitella]